MSGFMEINKVGGGRVRPENYYKRIIFHGTATKCPGNIKLEFHLH